MNRKGACHGLPVVLAVDGKGLRQEPEGVAARAEMGLQHEAKGVVARTERGSSKNRKRLQQEPRGGLRGF